MEAARQLASVPICSHTSHTSKTRTTLVLTPFPPPFFFRVCLWWLQSACPDECEWHGPEYTCTEVGGQPPCDRLFERSVSNTEEGERREGGGRSNTEGGQTEGEMRACVLVTQTQTDIRTRSLTHSFTRSHTHSLTHSLTHSHTLSLTCMHGCAALRGATWRVRLALCCPRMHGQRYAAPVPVCD